MVKPLPSSLRKHVGDEPVLQVLRKCSQDISGFRNTTGREGQPFEADHRISSPIGEPMVARNDRAFFIAHGVRLRRILDPPRRMNHELVGGKYKLRTKTGPQRWMCDFNESFATHAFCREGLWR